jgi:hypothetical protein
MAAIHPAAGMFGINKLVIAPFKVISPGCPVFTALAFKEKEYQQDNGSYNEVNVSFRGRLWHNIKIQATALRIKR